MTVLEGRVGRSEGGSYTDVGTKQCRDPKAGVSRCLPGNLWLEGREGRRNTRWGLSVTGYQILKSVSLATLGSYCKALSKAVIICLPVLGNASDMGPSGGDQGCRNSWGKKNRGSAFRAMLLSLVRSGIWSSEYFKGLAKRIHLTD